MITEQLPETILEMAEIIGITNTLAIVALRGGTRLTVPVKAKEDHWVVEIIGFESYQKLCRYYCGEELEIPRCKGVIGLITDREILDDRKNLTMTGLARKYDYTERGIRKLLRRAESQENK